MMATYMAACLQDTMEKSDLEHAPAYEISSGFETEPAAATPQDFVVRTTTLARAVTTSCALPQ